LKLQQPLGAFRIEFEFSALKKSGSIEAAERAAAIFSHLQFSALKKSGSIEAQSLTACAVALDKFSALKKSGSIEAPRPVLRQGAPASDFPL